MSVQPTPSLLIIGAGGHGRVVAEAALAMGAFSPLRATDSDPSKWHGELLPGVPLLPEQQAQAQGGAMHVAIGLASARERVVLKTPLPLATVVHPRACVSPFAQVGEGSFIGAQAVVAALGSVGRCTIINHGAVVDHDAEVGDFTHIAPLVALSGRARIGRRVLVGSGSQVLPGVSVCDDVVIGAGSVVRTDIDQPGVYAGVPARRLR